MQLTMARARALLQEAMMTQGPDFVYTRPDSGESCFYISLPELRLRGWSIGPFPEDPREITGCLIGVLFRLAGLDMEPFSRFEEYSLQAVMVDHPELFESLEVLEYLLKAQQAQDSGKTWGAAVAAAESWLSHREPEIYKRTMPETANA